MPSTAGFAFRDNRVFLSFPEKKKGAVGVRGMRLGDGELLTDVWQLNNEKEEIIMIKEKAVHLNRLRIANRDTRGVKK